MNANQQLYKRKSALGEYIDRCKRIYRYDASCTLMKSTTVNKKIVVRLSKKLKRCFTFKGKEEELSPCATTLDASRLRVRTTSSIRDHLKVPFIFIFERARFCEGRRHLGKNKESANSHRRYCCYI